MKTIHSSDWAAGSRNGLCVHTGLQAGKPLGDFIADITHQTGLDKVSGLFTQMTGLDCGCKRRQEWLNEKIPHFIG